MAKTPDQLKGWLHSRRKLRGSAEVLPGVSIIVRGDDVPITITDNIFAFRPRTDYSVPKPCPFCGASQTLFSFVLTLAFWKAGFNVECSKCGARGPSRVTKQRATDSWNYRAAQKGGAA